jgi:hypothetical protein
LIFKSTILKAKKEESLSELVKREVHKFKEVFITAIDTKIRQKHKIGINHKDNQEINGYAFASSSLLQPVRGVF